MFEHVSSQAKPVGKREGWKSKSYDADQSRRLKL